ncbi:unnamed protein product, partial [Discosporangium mesarthrocarpum]
RSSLEPARGELSPFSSPSEAQVILTALEDAEDWIYTGVDRKDKAALEARSNALQDLVQGLHRRREAHLAVKSALDDAEAWLATYDVELEKRRESISASEGRRINKEMEGLRRLVEDARGKLEATSAASAGSEYGALSKPVLPVKASDVRKKLEHLQTHFTAKAAGAREQEA